MSDKKYYHDKGEQDASEGKYSPPNGLFNDLTTWSESGMKRMNEENSAYNKGYSHGKGQKDGSKNEYNSQYSNDESYNSGWNNGNESSNGSSDGCFITTATLLSIGKDDACLELNSFRSFRDNWLAQQPDGKSLISEYYLVAPKIVSAIDSSSNREDIYRKLWVENLEPCLQLIDDHQYTEAKNVYCSVVHNLKAKFLG